MSSVEKRARGGRVSWRAHYRTPDGKQRTKTFDRKIDAERFLTTIESAKMTGSYVDPALARLTVGEWAERWLDGQAHLKPSTRERYAGILREHIDPRWGHVRARRRHARRRSGWVTTRRPSASRPPCARSTGCSRWSSRSRSRTAGWSETPPTGVNLPRVVTPSTGT